MALMLLRALRSVAATPAAAAASTTAALAPRFAAAPVVPMLGMDRRADSRTERQPLTGMSVTRTLILPAHGAGGMRTMATSHDIDEEVNSLGVMGLERRVLDVRRPPHTERGVPCRRRLTRQDAWPCARARPPRFAA